MRNLIFLYLLLATVAASAANIYVSKNGQDANDGTSWKNAFASVGKACQAAKNGDKICLEADTFLITETIYINKDLTYEGGYIVHGKENTTAKKAKNTSANPWEFEKETVLKGNNKVRLIDVTRAAGTVEFNAITFTNGFIQNNNDTQTLFCGGALRASASEMTKINNCRFIENHANRLSEKSNGANGYGGAIFSEYNIEINNCYFARNSDNGGFSGGGAIHLRTADNRSAVIKGCVFDSNSTKKNGGAICLAGSAEITISDCIFFNNVALSDEGPTPGAAAYVYGVYQTQEPSNATFDNCLFFNNYGQSCIFAMGGTYRNITVTNNGGNFEIQHAETAILTSIIWGNGINFSNKDAIMDKLATSQWMEGDVYPNLKELIKLNSNNERPNGPNFKKPSKTIGRARNQERYNLLLQTDWTLTEESPISGFGANLKLK